MNVRNIYGVILFSKRKANQGKEIEPQTVTVLFGFWF